MERRVLPRPPIELPQSHERGCVQAVVSQILYVFGLTNMPEPRKLGQAGKEMSYADAYLHLLQQGFYYLSYDSMDTERLLSEGRRYLQEYYATSWSNEHERRYTPEKVARIQQFARGVIARRQPFANQFRIVNRQAQPADIHQMLLRGWVVDVTLKVRTERRMNHAGLLVPGSDFAGDSNGSLAYLYSPVMDGAPRSTISRISLSYAYRRINQRAPVTGFWR